MDAVEDFEDLLMLLESHQVQLGIAPNRIDFLVEMGPVQFSDAWSRCVKAPYGAVNTNWIHLDDLEKIKSSIPDPRHQDDAKILRKVQKRRDRHA